MYLPEDFQASVSIFTAQSLNKPRGDHLFRTLLPSDRDVISCCVSEER